MNSDKTAIIFSMLLNVYFMELREIKNYTERHGEA
jgi:hypothetical protein